MRRFIEPIEDSGKCILKGILAEKNNTLFPKPVNPCLTIFVWPPLEAQHQTHLSLHIKEVFDVGLLCREQNPHPNWIDQSWNKCLSLLQLPTSFEGPPYYYAFFGVCQCFSLRRSKSANWRSGGEKASGSLGNKAWTESDVESASFSIASSLHCSQALWDQNTLLFQDWINQYMLFWGFIFQDFHDVI